MSGAPKNRVLPGLVQVRYITRFTEESFAALISIIFVMESFLQLFHTTGQSPPKLHTIYSHGVDASLDTLPGCACFVNGSRVYSTAWPAASTTSMWGEDELSNMSNARNAAHDESHGGASSSLAATNTTAAAHAGVAHKLAQDVVERLKACQHAGGVLMGSACENVPDVFFFCVILFILTFLISMGLRALRDSPFLPNKACATFENKRLYNA